MTWGEHPSLPCIQLELMQGETKRGGRAVWEGSFVVILTYLASPTPPKWSFVMSKLPLATIGCGECLLTKQSRRGVTPHCSGRDIERGRTPGVRQLRGCNMAKVVKKSWKPRTTSTKRWKKRKTTSQPRSRGISKVRWTYSSFSSSSPFMFPRAPRPHIPVPSPDNPTSACHKPPP